MKIINPERLSAAAMGDKKFIKELLDATITSVEKDLENISIAIAKDDF